MLRAAHIAGVPKPWVIKLEMRRNKKKIGESFGTEKKIPIIQNIPFDTVLCDVSVYYRKQYNLINPLTLTYKINKKLALYWDKDSLLTDFVCIYYQEL